MLLSKLPNMFLYSYLHLMWNDAKTFGEFAVGDGIIRMGARVQPSRREATSFTGEGTPCLHPAVEVAENVIVDIL